MKKTSAVKLMAGAVLSVAALGWIIPVEAQQAAPTAAASTHPLLFAAATGSDPSNAAPPQQANQLQEIVVTARKRTESLMSVPVAVSVVTQTQLQNNDANDLAKIAELTPQVMAGYASTGTGAVLSIRGIGSSPLDAGIDQSVLVDIDNIQLSRGRMMTDSQFDLKQVEVLEGPQALFFGKNSPAGVISIKSADPTDYFTGYVKGGYETEAAEKFGEGAISGPITDTLTARFALHVSGMDGWEKNIATPQVFPQFLPSSVIPYPDGLKQVMTPGAQDPTGPNIQNIAFRLSLHWTPTDDLDAMLKVTGNQTTFNGGDAFTEIYCQPGKQLVLFGFITVPGEDCTKNQVRDVSALPPVFAANMPHANGGQDYFFSQGLLTSLEVNKRFNNFTLTSTSGFYTEYVADAGTYDTSPLATIYDPESEDYRLFTEELRGVTSFNFPVNFTGGAFAERFSRPHYNNPFLGWEGYNPATGNAANQEGEFLNTGLDYSAFGQVRWNIIPSVELAGGARWSHDQKSVAFDQVAVNPNNIEAPYHPVGSVLSDHYGSYNVSPEATLTWHETQNQTLYVAYKTGYKSGGFSNDAVVPATMTVEELKFAPERSYGEEIGYKLEALNRTLRFSVDAYRYKYLNLQVTTFNPQTISYLIKNAASSRTEGFEATTTWLPLDGLQLHETFGYDDGYFINFPGAQCYSTQTLAGGCLPIPGHPGQFAQNLAGKALLHAPRFSFDLGFDYATEVMPNWTLDFAADADYTSSYVINETEDPNQLQNSYWLVNASLRISPTDGPYSFSFIGKNLMNSYYAIYSSGAAAASPYDYAAYFQRPRELILQAEYKF